MAEVMRVDNNSMRNIMSTVSSLIGENGLNSVLNFVKLSPYIKNLPPANLNLEIPIQDILSVKRGLKEVFGDKGANVLLRNAGKEYLRISVEGSPDIDKQIKAAIANLPEIKKVSFCVKTFTDIIMQRMTTPKGKERYSVEEKDNKVILTDRDNLMMVKNSGDKSDGYFVIGMHECLLEWFIGKKYNIKQTKAVADGDDADEYTISIE